MDAQVKCAQFCISMRRAGSAVNYDPLVATMDGQSSITPLSSIARVNVQRFLPWRLQRLRRLGCVDWLLACHVLPRRHYFIKYSARLWEMLSMALVLAKLSDEKD